MKSQRKRLTIGGDEEISSPVTTDPLPIPVISEANGILTLHFESDYIQSQMVVSDPDFLALAYSRTMMAFELFFPKPREVALIGLGGGSLAKWCYRHHPQTKLTVIEINPHVIALREAFRIPPDDSRFRILCEDGAKFVAETSGHFDVLLVDCFGADDLPRELCSQQFYDHCRMTLTEVGLMVVNLCDKNPRAVLSRIRKSFGGRILRSMDADGNTVVFACKGEPPWPKGGDVNSFQLEVKKFERRYGLGKALVPRG